MKPSKVVLVFLGLLSAIVVLVSSEVVTQTSTDKKSNELYQDDTKTEADAGYKPCSSWGGGGHHGGRYCGGGGGGGWGGGGSYSVAEDLDETNAIEDDKHHGSGGWGGGGRGGGWGGGGRGGGWGGGSSNMGSKDQISAPMIWPNCASCCNRWGRVGCAICRCP